jgi:hypothetical protein
MAYLYRHIRLDKNEPFYVGIGSDSDYKRAYNKKGRNKHWNNITNNTSYEVEIIAEDLTWEQACEKEIEFIKLYGRSDLKLGTLVNMTDGGEGQYGRIVKDATKLLLSNDRKGKSFTKGKTWKCKNSVSDETRNLISQNIERALKIKKANSFHVSQYDLQGNFIQEFQSVTEAKIKTNIQTIDKAARGNNKTAGGFIWKYK